MFSASAGICGVSELLWRVETTVAPLVRALVEMIDSFKRPQLPEGGERKL